MELKQALCILYERVIRVETSASGGSGLGPWSSRWERINVQVLFPSASCFLWKGRFREGNRGHKVRDRFLPFMLPYVENESNQFSLDLQVF